MFSNKPTVQFGYIYIAMYILETGTVPFHNVGKVLVRACVRACVHACECVYEKDREARQCVRARVSMRWCVCVFGCV